MLFMPRSGDHFWQVPLKPTTMQYPPLLILPLFMCPIVKPMLLPITSREKIPDMSILYKVSANFVATSLSPAAQGPTKQCWSVMKRAQKQCCQYMHPHAAAARLAANGEQKSSDALMLVTCTGSFCMHHSCYPKCQAHLRRTVI